MTCLAVIFQILLSWGLYLAGSDLAVAHLAVVWLVLGQPAADYSAVALLTCDYPVVTHLIAEPPTVENVVGVHLSVV